MHDSVGADPIDHFLEEMTGVLDVAADDRDVSRPVNECA